MPFLRKYNTLTVTGTTAIRVPIIKRGVVDFAVGADWTPATGDVKILVDGTAAANVTNLPTAIAGANTGAVWEFILTAAELSCKQCEVIISDAATKAIEDQSFIVETFGNASAMYVTDFSAALATPTNITAGTITTTTNLTNAPPDSSGVTTLLSRIPAALFSGITSLAQWLGLITGKQVGNSTARTEVRATGAGSGTFDETTDSQEALRDNTGTAGAGLSAMPAGTLTSGERTSIANEVEAQIIDETDSEKVLTAITDKIASVNPSLAGLTTSAIASAVRTNLATELARIDAAISTRAIEASLQTLISTVGVNGAGLTSADDATLAAIAALQNLSQANVRTALGLGSANLDTQLGVIAGYIDTEVATILSRLGSFTGAGSSTVLGYLAQIIVDILALNNLAMADIRTALGMSSANLDTQITAIGGFISTTSNSILAKLPLSLTGDGNIKADIVAIASSFPAAARLALSAGTIIPGTVDYAGQDATTTVFDADDITTAAADFYKDRLIAFTSGALAGQYTSISGYALVGGRGRFTVVALTSAPADNATFIIV